MRVIWFNGNFGNQIFYCAFKDYLREKYPQEKVYAFVDTKCPPVKIEERTNLFLPEKNVFVSLLSFIIFKVLGVLFRRVPLNYVPKWYCDREELNEGATFIGHSLQTKYFYENRNSNWLTITEDSKQNASYLKWKDFISNSNSVCIHLRRGDYIKPGSSYVDLSKTDYYEKAIDYARKRLPNAKLFFFSDDLNFVKETFKGDDIFYVDCNTGSNGYLDIKLMSLAKINVMANSTFSYWASYINHEQKIVIYPKQWFCEWTGRKAPTIMLDKDNWIGI